MNALKKPITLLMALAICLSLAACNKSGGDDANALGLHNRKNDVTVSLGMSMKDVEDRLGEGAAENPKYTPAGGGAAVSMLSQYTQKSYGQGADAITVIYENEKAVVIRVQTQVEMDTTPNWGTKQGLYFDATKEDLTSKQGEGERLTYEEQAASDPLFQGLATYTYYYNSEGAAADAWQNGGSWLQVMLMENEDSSHIVALYLSALSPDTNLYPTEEGES